MLNNSTDEISINKYRGIKIVNNGKNRKVSDVFNTKMGDTVQGPGMTYNEKMRNVKAVENFVDKKIRVKIK